VQTVLSELDEDALIQILTKPKNSVVKQFLMVFCFLAILYTINGDFFFSTTALSITTSFILLDSESLTVEPVLLNISLYVFT
jgi:ATP-dependent protease Clp ATPase subunit